MGTHYKGTEKEMAALSAFITLVRASDSVTSRVGRLLEEQGLTSSQLGVMESLLHLGPMCQKHLADKLLKSGGNLVMVIDNLERKGWVQRVRDEEDRRKVMIVLTDEGRRVISEVFPKHAKAICAEMGVLTVDELGALRQLCKKDGIKGAT